MDGMSGAILVLGSAKFALQPRKGGMFMRQILFVIVLKQP